MAGEEVSGASAAPADEREGRIEPTRPFSRLEVLDVLRGFAILGILSANLAIFINPEFWGHHGAPPSASRPLPASTVTPAITSMPGRNTTAPDSADKSSEVSPDGGRVRVAFLDVGQGESAPIELPGAQNRCTLRASAVEIVASATYTVQVGNLDTKSSRSGTGSSDGRLTWPTLVRCVGDVTDPE